MFRPTPASKPAPDAEPAPSPLVTTDLAAADTPKPEVAITTPVNLAAASVDSATPVTLSATSLAAGALLSSPAGSTTGSNVKFDPTDSSSASQLSLTASGAPASAGVPKLAPDYSQVRCAFSPWMVDLMVDLVVDLMVDLVLLTDRHFQLWRDRQRLSRPAKVSA